MNLVTKCNEKRTAEITSQCRKRKRHKWYSAWTLWTESTFGICKRCKQTVYM